jgi:hypothetical protein
MNSKRLDKVIPLKLTLLLGILVLLSLPMRDSTGLATILRSMSSSISDVLLALLLLAAMKGTGSLAIRVLKRNPDVQNHSSGWAWGMGFIFIGSATLGLGFCGLLYPTTIGLSWLPGIMYFLMEARQSLAGKIKNQFSFQNRLFHPDNLLIEITGWFCFCLFLYLALLQLPSGFLPPVGYDALEYHFGAPTYYLEHHSISYLPGNAYANFPALTEMIITAGLVVKGFVISKLFIWMMGVLTAWSLYQLGKAHFSAFAGIFAASMFLALPMTLKMNLQGNIDMATAFFGVLALHTFLDWRDNKRFSSILMAGLFAGGALGTKYIALTMFCIPLLLLIILSDGKLNAKIKPTVLLMTGTIIPFSPWLIKNWILTGNPVFPLLYHVWGGYGWNSFIASKFSQAHAFPLSLPQILAHLKELFMPFNWDGSSAPYTLVPIFLIPIFYMAGRFNDKEKYLWGMVCLGTLAWIFTNQVDRYLLPVFAILSLAVSVPLVESFQEGILHSEKRRAIGFLTLVVIAMVICNGINQYQLESGLLRLATMEQPVENQFKLSDYKGNDLSATQENFLKQFDSLYPATLVMNQLPAEKRILFIGEARRMFVNQETEISTVFDRDFYFELAKSSSSLEEMSANLKEAHIGYIFYNPQELKRLESFYGPYYDPSQKREIPQKMAAYLSRKARPVWEDRGMALYEVTD